MNLKKSLSVLCCVVLGSAALYAEDAPKKSTWENLVGVGLTLTKGNSDTLLFNLNGASSKKWLQNELMFAADLSYGESDGVKNNDSLRASAQYNRLFNEKLFGYLRVEGLRDTIADIDYRFTFSPGAGYYFIKNTNTFLRAEVGPGYIIEKQGGKTDDYVTLRLAERFEHKLTEKSKIWQSVEFLPQVDDWNNFIINAEVGISTEIAKGFSLMTYLQDTFDNEPAPGRDQNDVKLVAGIGYKF